MGTCSGGRAPPRRGHPPARNGSKAGGAGGSRPARRQARRKVATACGRGGGPGDAPDARLGGGTHTTHTRLGRRGARLAMLADQCCPSVFDRGSRAGGRGGRAAPGRREAAPAARQTADREAGSASSAARAQLKTPRGARARRRELAQATARAKPPRARPHHGGVPPPPSTGAGGGGAPFWGRGPRLARRVTTREPHKPHQSSRGVYRRRQVRPTKSAGGGGCTARWQGLATRGAVGRVRKPQK
ncbi:MAG: hypothetical protein J3K34DRAFT_437908 [Monoraphidium minutum]|nr:MAG: hypothetical protein J3K34DRAFT_437908 [Monoraphidium minutum]